MHSLSLDDPRWWAFVQSRPEAVPFHYPSWARVLAECYRYHPFVLVMTDDVGGIVAGLPVMDVTSRIAGPRWISLPFTSYCPPLVTSPDFGTVFTSGLVQELRSHHLDSFEVRGALSEMEGVTARQIAHRYRLPLSTDSDTLFQQMKPTLRRHVRAAQRYGVRIKLGTSMGEVRQFYKLHLMTRRRQGVPVEPYRFFTLLHREMLQKGLGFIATAYMNELPVAANVFLASKGTLVWEFGASDPRFRRYSPNNLLLWTVIEKACTRHYRILDLGPTGHDNKGNREFKLGWGATAEPLMYSLVTDSNLDVASASGRHYIGRALRGTINRSPLWVTRAIGELGYRYRF